MNVPLPTAPDLLLCGGVLFTGLIFGGAILFGWLLEFLLRPASVITSGIAGGEGTITQVSTLHPPLKRKRRSRL